MESSTLKKLAIISVFTEAIWIATEHAPNLALISTSFTGASFAITAYAGWKARDAIKPMIKEALTALF